MFNDDAKLIKILKSNNEEEIRYAFKCVYEKYFKLVCFCISQYVNSKEDVEELANDTFLSFFNNIDNLDLNKNIKYYILVTAKNNAINHIKKHSKYTLLSDEQLINIAYEESYESNDIINYLKEILSNEEISIMINHLLYGYSFKEIAKKENKSINTIMSKYRRSVKKAQIHLKEVIK